MCMEERDGGWGGLKLAATGEYEGVPSIVSVDSRFGVGSLCVAEGKAVPWTPDILYGY